MSKSVLLNTVANLWATLMWKCRLGQSTET
jgi:hypothetical protein